VDKLEGRPGKARACFFIDYCDEGAGRTGGRSKKRVGIVDNYENFVILWAIWRFGCRLVVWIFFTNHSRKVKGKESIR